MKNQLQEAYERFEIEQRDLATTQREVFMAGARAALALRFDVVLAQERYIVLGEVGTTEDQFNRQIERKAIGKALRRVGAEVPGEKPECATADESVTS